MHGLGLACHVRQHLVAIDLTLLPTQSRNRPEFLALPFLNGTVRVES